MLTSFMLTACILRHNENVASPVTSADQYASRPSAEADVVRIKQRIATCVAGVVRRGMESQGAVNSLYAEHGITRNSSEDSLIQ